jgi:hypothetical protein
VSIQANLGAGLEASTYAVIEGGIGSSIGAAKGQDEWRLYKQPYGQYYERLYKQPEPGLEASIGAA